MWEFLGDAPAQLVTFPMTTGVHNFSALPDHDDHVIKSCVDRSSYVTEDTSQGSPAIAIALVTAPQYVFGAATPGWHLSTEIKSGHATDCRLRRDQEGGKK
jgi:hypothetical protein